MRRDESMCPPIYGSQLATTPVYRTAYVLAHRNDKGFDFNSFDDPKLKQLRIRWVPDLGIREALVETPHRRQSQASRHYP